MVRWIRVVLDWRTLFQSDLTTWLNHSATFDLGVWLQDFKMEMRDHGGVFVQTKEEKGAEQKLPKICLAQACLEKWQLSTLC